MYVYVYMYIYIYIYIYILQWYIQLFTRWVGVVPGEHLLLTWSSNSFQSEARFHMDGSHPSVENTGFTWRVTNVPGTCCFFDGYTCSTRACVYAMHATHATRTFTHAHACACTRTHAGMRACDMLAHVPACVGACMEVFKQLFTGSFTYLKVI